MTDLSNLNSDELNGYYKCACELKEELSMDFSSMSKEDIIDTFQSAILTKVLSSHMALTDMNKYKAIYDLAMTVDE